MRRNGLCSVEKTSIPAASKGERKDDYPFVWIYLSESACDQLIVTSSGLLTFVKVLRVCEWTVLVIDGGFGAASANE